MVSTNPQKRYINPSPWHRNIGKRAWRSQHFSDDQIDGLSGTIRDPIFFGLEWLGCWCQRQVSGASLRYLRSLSTVDPSFSGSYRVWFRGSSNVNLGFILHGLLIRGGTPEIVRLWYLNCTPNQAQPLGFIDWCRGYISSTKGLMMTGKFAGDTRDGKCDAENDEKPWIADIPDILVSSHVLFYSAFMSFPPELVARIFAGQPYFGWQKRHDFQPSNTSPEGDLVVFKSLDALRTPRTWLLGES